MPMKNATAIAIPVLKPRSRNRLSSTSGEPSRRAFARSYSTNSANTGTETAIDTNVQVGQPSSRPCTSGYSSRSSAAEISTTPTGSSFGGRGARDSRTRIADASIATMPDRHVDQEDRPPVPAEQVVLDQQPAQQRPADGAEPGGDAEAGQRLDPLGGREDDLDDGQHLRAP